MAPTWLTAIAWVYISICVICAGAITYDIAVNRRRQPMGVMNFVFPITALYFGPFALALYWRWARVRRLHAGHDSPQPADRRVPTIDDSIEVATSGSCRTLGDFISEWLIFAFAITIAGSTLLAESRRGLRGSAPHHLMPDSIAFWLMMQLGMIIGYFSSWPANVWLVKRGIKVPM